MPELPERASPLAGVLAPGEAGLIGPGGPGVWISERRDLSIVQVAALPDQHEATIGAIEEKLGVRPSTEPGTAIVTGRTSAFWIAPEQWLVVADAMAESELYRAVHQAAGAHAAIVDHSHGRSVLRLAGPGARTLLAKGCPLDLHPEAFGPGRCAQSLIGQIGALVHLVDPTPTFDLYIASSYAHAFCGWMIESAAEFGYQVT